MSDNNDSSHNPSQSTDKMSAQVARITFDPAYTMAQSEHHQQTQVSLTTARSPAHSRNPSPDARVNVQNPIPEEAEDDSGNEVPITPTSEESCSSSLHQNQHDGAAAAVATRAPLIVNTAATPLASPTSKPTSAQQPATESKGQRGHESTIRRGLTHLFHRTNSHKKEAKTPSSPTPKETPVATPAPSLGRGGSDPILNTSFAGPMKRNSFLNSSSTSGSNSPPTPGSPKERSSTKNQHLEPDASQMFNKNKQRSSTGLSHLRNRVIGFKEPIKPPRHRSASAETKTAGGKAIRAAGTGAGEAQRTFGFGAEAGTGLKARRMSVSLPDDLFVDVVELYQEFSDSSKMIGRRGKTLGKGTTSVVRTMVRKDGGNELYAVKEFRGKGTNESQEDYEKKVKSEFCIAKSLHHPNVVETVRLCTHNGNWNHVMEYCDQGDLFSLVKKGYLKAPDRAVDRLCLFKQLIQGVNYLHQHGIAHRDIKLENLLITSDSKLKITDFGVSEVFCGLHPGVRDAGGECGKSMADIRLCDPGICGSLPYIAPEVLEKKEQYDPRGLDVWSSAVVMLYLIFGGSIWECAKANDNNPNYKMLVTAWAKWEAKHEAGETMSESDYPRMMPFDKFIDQPVIRRILLGMLHPDPAKRSTIAQVAKNGWLSRHVECCTVESYNEPAGTIDATKLSKCSKVPRKVVMHNHLPPTHHFGHSLVRLPGSTAM